MLRARSATGNFRIGSGERVALERAQYSFSISLLEGSSCRVHGRVIAYRSRVAMVQVHLLTYGVLTKTCKGKCKWNVIHVQLLLLLLKLDTPSSVHTGIAHTRRRRLRRGRAFRRRHRISRFAMQSSRHGARRTVCDLVDVLGGESVDELAAPGLDKDLSWALEVQKELQAHQWNLKTA